MATARFVYRILKRYLLAPADTACPYCGRTLTDRLANKKLLLWLLRCQSCGLMFRYPKDDPQASLRYYDGEYSQACPVDARISTPVTEDLSRHYATDFRSVKDFSWQIQLLKSYEPSGRLLDFGCSWGYGIWQFNQVGYEAYGFEISRRRARYGREHLEVNIIDSLEELAQRPAGSVDIVFAHHVLEHMPDISSIFPMFHRLLRPTGLLAVFVPDCTGCDSPVIFRTKESFAIGQSHTLAFDQAFFQRNLPREGFQIVRCDSLNARELIVLARGLHHSDAAGSLIERGTTA